ncbi:MAG TPA: hypothetical protein VJB16_00475 [archaeon]|nr:hypothetical protein [archaeon]
MDSPKEDIKDSILPDLILFILVHDWPLTEEGLHKVMVDNLGMSKVTREDVAAAVAFLRKKKRLEDTPEGFLIDMEYLRKRFHIREYKE